MAAIWAHWVPIWSAVARAPTASTRAARPNRDVRLPIPARGHRPWSHRSLRPPWSMPSAARAATSAATWSRIVTAGNREPHGLPSRARELGPVEPRQPPRTLVAMAHHLVVSIGTPGPAMPSHQPFGRVAGTGRADDVRVAGQCVQHDDDVVARGDSSPQRWTAMLTSSRTAPLESPAGRCR